MILHGYVMDVASIYFNLISEKSCFSVISICLIAQNTTVPMSLSIRYYGNDTAYIQYHIIFSSEGRLLFLNRILPIVAEVIEKVYTVDDRQQKLGNWLFLEAMYVYDGNLKAL